MILDMKFVSSSVLLEILADFDTMLPQHKSVPTSGHKNTFDLGADVDQAISIGVLTNKG